MKRLITTLLPLLLAACTAKVPQEYREISKKPAIWPDYADITVPANIAPLNFRIKCPGEKFVTRYSAGNTAISVKGGKTGIPESEWKKLLGGGGPVTVDIFARLNDEWIHYMPISINVAEPIDNYISYRLIPPSAVSYEGLTINQRDLTSFKEKVIYSNSLVQKGENGQCINCHHYSNYKTDNMQFHARQYKGGTILVIDGELRKVNLKTDSTLSAGVYPAWHPYQDCIAYSTNSTKQSFHLSDPNRTEVYDLASDLILYDIRQNSVSPIENDPDQFECFPAWAPDGKTLYYVSAYLQVPDSVIRESWLIDNSRQFHYDIYAKPFNPETMEWQPSRKIFDAAAIGRSATFPRISPDGRYMIFTLGEYGVFHIWHRDADLYIMDLSDGSVRPLDEINSNDVESYHSWSSNGKWIVFSSRRDDGGYTRLYLSHFGDDGKFSKPFALPQKDPDFADQFMRSYNIPEFMTEPVSISAHKFARFINRHSAESVSYTPKKEIQAPTDSI